MTRTGTLSVNAALAGALIVAGYAVPASAQATWSLPPGPNATDTPRPQGPVDAQAPVVRPSDAPSEAPRPAPSPPVLVAAPPPPASAKQAQTPAPARPEPRATATPAPQKAPQVAMPAPAAASPQPAATPESTSSFVPAPAASETPAPAPSVAAPAETAPAATAEHWPDWWWAIPIALLLAAGGIVALLRRRTAPATAWAEAGLEPEGEEEDAPKLAEAPKPAPAPVTPAPITAAPRPAPVVPPAPKPLTSAIVSPLPKAAPLARAEWALEPVLLRQSLVYATLQYRLALTAPASGLAEGASVAADMIAAHASLSQTEQLAPDPASVPLRHRFGALEPGETREVKGEIQLPLNAIRAVRQGDAALFVPLVRLFLTLPDGTIERRVFSLGQPGTGAGLAPLRVDTGPRDHAPILAREIEGARSIGGAAPSGVPEAAE
ncbi:hypothetical protein [Novosphingobium sp. PhB165]|uniref:hypothetical protein n=1 Tax=Novosphingobium sp. PhB165 TaxID=2485105 RepID=UPI001046072F|nr:hypothetical protein [Novosphingobium sp. PhB165]